MRPIYICTCVLIMALSAPMAHADADAAQAELSKAVEEQIDALTKALSAKDADAINDAVTGVSIRYDEITDEKLRESVRKVLGKAIRYKDDGVKHVVIDAFTRMGDPLAYKYIAPFLRQTDRKKTPKLFEPAIRAVETLQPDDAVKPLVDLIKKSKNLSVGTRAMQALGAFRQSALKAKIMREIINTVRKEKPGVKGRENPNYYGNRRTGAQARNRWEALAAPMVATANALTGHELSSPTEWFDFYTRNKRKPDVLFASQ